MLEHWYREDFVICKPLICNIKVMDWKLKVKTFSDELRGCEANGSREEGEDLSQHKSNQSLLLLDLVKTEKHHHCFSFLQTIQWSHKNVKLGECKIQRQYNGSDPERRLKASPFLFYRIIDDLFIILNSDSWYIVILYIN